MSPNAPIPELDATDHNNVNIEIGKKNETGLGAEYLLSKTTDGSCRFWRGKRLN